MAELLCYSCVSPNTKPTNSNFNCSSVYYWSSPKFTSTSEADSTHSSLRDMLVKGKKENKKY